MREGYKNSIFRPIGIVIWLILSASMSLVLAKADPVLSLEDGYPGAPEIIAQISPEKAVPQPDLPQNEEPQTTQPTQSTQSVSPPIETQTDESSAVEQGKMPMPDIISAEQIPSREEVGPVTPSELTTGQVPARQSETNKSDRSSKVAGSTSTDTPKAEQQGSDRSQSSKSFVDSLMNRYAVAAWLVVVVIGIVRGFRGRLTIFRDYGDVGLAGALAISPVVMLLGSGLLDQWVAWLVLLVDVGLFIWIAKRTYDDNYRLGNALMAFITKITLVIAFAVLIPIYFLIGGSTKLQAQRNRASVAAWMAGMALLALALVRDKAPSASETSEESDSKSRSAPSDVREERVATAWDVLGLTNGASLEEIKRAYYSLIVQYHPDKVAHLGPELRALAEEKAKTINEAYATLCKG